MSAPSTLPWVVPAKHANLVAALLGRRLMLLRGKLLVITGVLTDDSIAFAVAYIAQLMGAKVILTTQKLSLTTRIAGRLPYGPDHPRGARVMELDVTNAEHYGQVLRYINGRRGGEVHGFLHAIAGAPKEMLQRPMAEVDPDALLKGIDIGGVSLLRLIQGLWGPIVAGQADIVYLDFDSSGAIIRGYEGMGAPKQVLDYIGRALGNELGKHGCTLNGVAAGPLSTLSSKALGGDQFKAFAEQWGQDAPLDWDHENTVSVALAVCSIWAGFHFMTTAERFAVDGGRRNVGPAMAPA